MGKSSQHTWPEADDAETTIAEKRHHIRSSGTSVS
jgi:hypothetical protein